MLFLDREGRLHIRLGLECAALQFLILLLLLEYFKATTLRPGFGQITVILFIVIRDNRVLYYLVRRTVGIASHSDRSLINVLFEHGFILLNLDWAFFDVGFEQSSLLLFLLHFNFLRFARFPILRLLVKPVTNLIFTVGSLHDRSIDEIVIRSDR